MTDVEKEYIKNDCTVSEKDSKLNCRIRNYRKSSDRIEWLIKEITELKKSVDSDVNILLDKLDESICNLKYVQTTMSLEILFEVKKYASEFPTHNKWEVMN